MGSLSTNLHNIEWPGDDDLCGQASQFHIKHIIHIGHFQQGEGPRRFHEGSLTAVVQMLHGGVWCDGIGDSLAVSCGNVMSGNAVYQMGRAGVRANGHESQPFKQLKL